MSTDNMVDMEAINEMDRYAALINGIENSNTDEIDAKYRSIVEANGGLGRSDIAGMEDAIRALQIAESASHSESKTNIQETSDLDDLDSEMSYSSSEFMIEKVGDHYSLTIGGNAIITKSYSNNGLKKLKNILESGKGFEHPETIKLVRNISIQVAAKQTIKESKQKYRSLKLESDTSGMNEQKRIYNSAKKQLSTVERLLED